jgi:hypothetical protein
MAARIQEKRLVCKALEEMRLLRQCNITAQNSTLKNVCAVMLIIDGRKIGLFDQ